MKAQQQWPRKLEKSLGKMAMKQMRYLLFVALQKSKFVSSTS